LLARLAEPDMRADPVYLPSSLPTWLTYMASWHAPASAEVRRAIDIVDFDGAAPMIRDTRRLIGPPPDVTDAALTFVLDRRLLLLGRVSGVGPAQKEPDEGWASREVHRFEQLTARCVAMTIFGLAATEVAALRESLAARPWRLEVIAQSPQGG